MLNPLYAAFLLAVEAQKVIELRLVRITCSGAEGQAEMVSMVAAMEAASTLMAGGTQNDVIAHYRAFVADNTHRLVA